MGLAHGSGLFGMGWVWVGPNPTQPMILWVGSDPRPALLLICNLFFSVTDLGKKKYKSPNLLFPFPLIKRKTCARLLQYAKRTVDESLSKKRCSLKKSRLKTLGFEPEPSLSLDF